LTHSGWHYSVTFYIGETDPRERFVTLMEEAKRRAVDSIPAYPSSVHFIDMFVDSRRLLDESAVKEVFPVLDYYEEALLLEKRLK
jgi:hypothetical protein